jgi:aminopeptidase
LDLSRLPSKCAHQRNAVEYLIAVQLLASPTPPEAMPDTRLAKLADLLVRHCVKVRRGDLVTIVAEPGALSAVAATYSAVLKAGGHPSFHPKSERLRDLLLANGSEEQLRHVSPFEAHRLSKCDVLIVLQSREPPSHHVHEPRRIAMAESARKELLALSLERAATGALRYVLAEVPCEAGADQLRMSLGQYEEWIFRSCFLHCDEPIAAWEELHAKQAGLVARLSVSKSLRIRSPALSGRHEGTDLVIDVDGRHWVNCGGSENMPDGEIFTGPRSITGVVNFTAPTSYRHQTVEGIRLRFESGRIVDASARRNEAFLIAMLDQDDGARVAGELGLGTNEGLVRLTGNPFFDEKVAGTFHLGIGAGYPQTGNSNVSALHWDMVSDLRPGATSPGSAGGTIEADGVVIQRDGRFV